MAKTGRLLVTSVLKAWTWGIVSRAEFGTKAYSKFTGESVADSAVRLFSIWTPIWS